MTLDRPAITNNNSGTFYKKKIIQYIFFAHLALQEIWIINFTTYFCSELVNVNDLTPSLPKYLYLIFYVQFKLFSIIICGIIVIQI